MSKRGWNRRSDRLIPISADMATPKTCFERHSKLRARL